MILNVQEKESFLIRFCRRLHAIDSNKLLNIRYYSGVFDCSLKQFIRKEINKRNMYARKSRVNLIKRHRAENIK